MTKTMRPIMIPKGMKAAPDQILKITRCNCNASHCKTSACSCFSAGLPCSQYCGCQENGCENKWNQVVLDNDDDIGEEEDEEKDTDNEDQ